VDVCPRCKAKCELEFIGYYDNDAGIYKCPECHILMAISIKYFE